MKIAYLPLDSRPCNVRFPVQLAEMAGLQVVTPPPEMLDYFRTPSDYETLSQWLLENAGEVSELVLSADQLCYGSLLASRELQVCEKEALRRLALLKTLKERFPELKIFGFSILMRSSISTCCVEDVPWYNMMTEYSQAVHRAALHGGGEDEETVRRLRQTLPPGLLEKYHAVRGRNHAINSECLKLVELGIFDRFLLLQEDSQPYGIHRMEQEILRRQLDAMNRKDSVFLHNGTDEAGCACMAALFLQEQNAPFRLKVDYLRQPCGQFTAMYEDRSFEENLKSHCAAIGIELVGEGPYDGLLWVYPPNRGLQRDLLVCNEGREEDENELAEMAKLVVDSLNSEKNVGLLDVAFANGGGERLPVKIAAAADLPALCYAGWNTASNALGTVLAQMVLGRCNPEKNRLFTCERLLDDCIYQGRVRAQVQQELIASGEDVYQLREKGAATRLLRERTSDEGEAAIFQGNTVSFSVDLPWPRTFEAAFFVTQTERNIKSSSGTGKGI